jgi:hypothetical protein
MMILIPIALMLLLGATAGEVLVTAASPDGPVMSQVVDNMEEAINEELKIAYKCDKGFGNEIGPQVAKASRLTGSARVKALRELRKITYRKWKQCKATS